MPSKLLTPDEIEELQKNPNVFCVDAVQIIYTNEFKRHFVNECKAGRSPTYIFENAGFRREVVGQRRIERAKARWMKSDRQGDLDSAAIIRPKRINTSSSKFSENAIIHQQEAKIHLLEAEVELLKKVEWKERRRGKTLSSSEVFEIIKFTVAYYQLKNVISYLCRSAGVSRSGYYNYIANEPKRLAREEHDLKDRDLILEAYNYRGFKKGCRSIKMLLQNQFGICFNKKRISRLMRKYHIVCPIRKNRPFKYWAIHEDAIAPNLLQRRFRQGYPGKVMLTDVSYLKYGTDKTAYLSTILDAETNEILGYSISPTMTMEFIFQSLEQLRSHPFIKEDAMIHSDQGWHYVNPSFRARVFRMGLKQSMSRKGNCWDNAPQESFFGHLKNEADLVHCKTYEALVIMVANYIDYYNKERYQWKRGRMSPVQYRNHLLSA